MSDNDAPEERRTEGVRIIGAQEAAEAAGRPDVVRRRRRSEKRYGDRPDAPEPVSSSPRTLITLAVSFPVPAARSRTRRAPAGRSHARASRG